MVNQHWRSSLSLVLSVLLWSVLAMADISCYNPDGSQAKDDVPCTSDATTFCCNRGDVCMSNGLCYLQAQRGFVLSRASCTDRSWNSCGSYTYCMPYNKGSGFPIVAAKYNGSKTSHCCGTAAWDNEKDTIDCGNFKSVNIPSGTAIPGVAGLAAKSSTSASTSASPFSTTTPVSTNSGSNTSRETAIGAGVGVPLGVIALASIIWAMWERRARLKALSTPSPMPVDQPAMGTVHQLGTPQRFVELGAFDVSEIASSDRPKSRGESQR